MSDEVTVPLVLLRELIAAHDTKNYGNRVRDEARALLPPEPAPVPEWMKPGAMAVAMKCPWQRLSGHWWGLGTPNTYTDEQMLALGAVQLVPAVPVENDALTITLTQYERDNLLAALVAIWMKGAAPWLNTGDWVGQIPWKLGYKGDGDLTDWGTLNSTAEQLAAARARWADAVPAQVTVEQIEQVLITAKGTWDVVAQRIYALIYGPVKPSDAHPDWCKCQRVCGGDQ